MSDDIKLACAGEFMTACDNSNPDLLSTAVGILAQIKPDTYNCDFIEGLGEAFICAVEMARQFAGDVGDPDANLESFIDFSHKYLAKAYEKKVGRA